MNQEDIPTFIIHLQDHSIKSKRCKSLKTRKEGVRRFAEIFSTRLKLSFIPLFCALFDNYGKPGGG